MEEEHLKSLFQFLNDLEYLLQIIALLIILKFFLLKQI